MSVVPLSICMIGFLFHLLENTTWMVLVGPKAISTTFVVIPKSNLLWVKLGTPQIIIMEVGPSVVHKCLKFSHERIVHTVQDTRFQLLITYKGFTLDHFWSTLVGPMNPQEYFLYKTYYKQKIGELAYSLAQSVVSLPPPAPIIAPSILVLEQTIPYAPSSSRG